MSPGPSTASCAGREAAQDLERQSGLSARSRWRAVAPAATARVPAAGRRRRSRSAGPTPPPGAAIAHHQVVEARDTARTRIGAATRRRRRRCRLTPCTSSVQPRAGSAAKSASRNGPCDERPARAVAHDEARFDVVAHRERDELARGEDTRETGHRGADQERVLLPEPPEERGGVQAARGSGVAERPRMRGIAYSDAAAQPGAISRAGAATLPGLRLLVIASRR